MASVEIGRLTLDVPGLTPPDGHRLAEIVAKGLADARWAPARGAEHIGLAVSAPATGASLEQLAGLIVAELRRRTS